MGMPLGCLLTMPVHLSAANLFFLSNPNALAKASGCLSFRLDMTTTMTYPIVPFNETKIDLYRMKSSVSNTFDGSSVLKENQLLMNSNCDSLPLPPIIGLDVQGLGVCQVDILASFSNIDCAPAFGLQFTYGMCMRPSKIPEITLVSAKPYWTRASVLKQVVRSYCG